MKLLSFILWISIIAVAQAEFPSDITRCHFGDEKCIARSVQDCLQRLSHNGSAAIGLQPFHELKLSNVTLLKAEPDAPMQVNLIYNNLIITKLDTMTIDRVVGFDKDIDNSKFEIYGRGPLLRVHGDYVASGKILLLPINGGGESTIDIIDPQLSGRMKIKKVFRDGKYYAKLINQKVTLEAKRMTFDMENLFKGNEEMSVALNNLLNENWQDIWAEMQPTVISILTDLFKNMIIGVLDTVPYEELFLPD